MYQLRCWRLAIDRFMLGECYKYAGMLLDVSDSTFSDMYSRLASFRTFFLKPRQLPSLKSSKSFVYAKIIREKILLKRQLSHLESMSRKWISALWYVVMHILIYDFSSVSAQTFAPINDVDGCMRCGFCKTRFAPDAGVAPLSKCRVCESGIIARAKR